MELSLATRAVSDHVVLEVGGEIDVYTAPKVRERLIEMIRRWPAADRGRPCPRGLSRLDRPRGAGRRAAAVGHLGWAAGPGVPARAAAEDLPDHRPGFHFRDSPLDRGGHHRRISPHRPRWCLTGARDREPHAAALVYRPSRVHAGPRLRSDGPARRRGGGPTGRRARRHPRRGAARDRRGMHPGGGAAPPARPGRQDRHRDERRRSVHRAGHRPWPGRGGLQRARRGDRSDHGAGGGRDRRPADSERGRLTVGVGLALLRGLGRGPRRASPARTEWAPKCACHGRSTAAR